MKSFYEYILRFYGVGGIYDMGANINQIKIATALHKKAVGDIFEGDTIDRECVREILIEKFNLVFPEAPLKLSEES